MEKIKNTRPNKKKQNNLLVLVCALFVALIISEGILRLIFPSHPYIWTPGLEATFYPDSTIMPGIHGPSYFATDFQGLRSVRVPYESPVNILVIGGSTSECIYLDQKESWPHLLQERLNDSLPEDYWVLNGGKSGKNTVNHKADLDELLNDELSGMDVVIFLVGINDFSYAIGGKDYVAFSKKGAEIPFYKKMGFWQLARKLKQSFRSNDGFGQDDGGKIYTEWRNHRKNAPKIFDTLPDLTMALNEYRNNIESLIQLSRESGSRPIFLTQPVMWHDTLSSELQELLWMGGVGEFQLGKGEGYYSIGALQEGMDRFNRVLIEVCTERKVEYLDLSSLISKDASAFYDDCHFNENGARIVAKNVSGLFFEE